MIRVNLLPFRAARKKENVRQQLTIFVLGTILLIGGLYYYHDLLNQNIRGLQTDISRTEREIVKYKRLASQVDELNAKLDILNKKLDTIEKLESNRQLAFNLLDDMTRSIVKKRMWFTDLKSEIKELAPKKTGKRRRKKKEAAAPQKFVLHASVEGIALDNKTVADFMTRLEDGYAPVELVTLQKQVFKQPGNRPDINLKSFRIAFEKTLAPGKQEDQVAKGAANKGKKG